jgi:hypothetical protein
MIPRLFYFPLLLVAKFGALFLCMIPNPPTSQIWRKKKHWLEDDHDSHKKQFEYGVCHNAKLP